MRFKIVGVFLIASALSQVSFAQQERGFWDKFYAGGTAGLQFGDQTLVNISPLFGYKFTDKISGGITATYIYYKFTDPYHYYPDFSTSIYGGSVFGRYFFAENFFAHAEFQELNVQVYEAYQSGSNIIFGEHRVYVPNLFLGGGYIQRIGERASFQLMLLYDVVQDKNSIYRNPIIRVGFGFGL